MLLLFLLVGIAQALPLLSPSDVWASRRAWVELEMQGELEAVNEILKQAFVDDRLNSATLYTNGTEAITTHEFFWQVVVHDLEEKGWQVRHPSACQHVVRDFVVTDVDEYCLLEQQRYSSSPLDLQFDVLGYTKNGKTCEGGDGKGRPWGPPPSSWRVTERVTDPCIVVQMRGGAGPR